MSLILCNFFYPKDEVLGEILFKIKQEIPLNAFELKRLMLLNVVSYVNPAISIQPISIFEIKWLFLNQKVEGDILPYVTD